jgi:hypothetical protein
VEARRNQRRPGVLASEVTVAFAVLFDDVNNPLLAARVPVAPRMMRVAQAGLVFAVTTADAITRIALPP